MPTLLKNGALVEDVWTEVGMDDPLPEGPAIIPAARLAQTSRAQLGIRVPNNFDIETLAPDLSRIEVIVLEFPKFIDGRAYSQARKLREMGYSGELRATGNVLTDQLLFMHRCGFDAFVMAKGDPVAAWERAMSLYSGFYQPAADHVMPAFLRRRAGSPACTEAKVGKQ
jgi:uncharacterized protein (DUF934 family)